MQKKSFDSNLDREKLEVQEIEIRAELSKLRAKRYSFFSIYNIGGFVTLGFMLIGLVALFSARSFQDESYLILIALGIIAYLIYSSYEKKYKQLEQFFEEELRIIQKSKTFDK